MRKRPKAYAPRKMRDKNMTPGQALRALRAWCDAAIDDDRVTASSHKTLKIRRGSPLHELRLNFRPTSRTATSLVVRVLFEQQQGGQWFGLLNNSRPGAPLFKELPRACCTFLRGYHIATMFDERQMRIWLAARGA